MLKIIVVILLMVDFAASRRIQQEKIKFTKVLISTGDATGTTEIIDLVNHEDASCENLQYDYPIQTRDGIGSNLVDLLLSEFPVICGGYDKSSLGKCFRLTKEGWQEFTTLNGRGRYSAAGQRFGDIFQIFGGNDFNSKLKSTEIIHPDGRVVQGPDMPTPLDRH